jgi:Flp pilus assembly protein TadG
VWNRRLGSLAENRAGATAVEFAILAPVMFAMLFGVFQLGWALHCNQNVDFAVQRATRQLVGTPSLTQPQIQANVRSLLTGPDPSQVTVNLIEDPAGTSPRKALVTAAYAHSIDVPLLNSFSYTYNTSSTMVLSP